MNFGECVADTVIYLQGDSNSSASPCLSHDSESLLDLNKVHGMTVTKGSIFRGLRSAQTIEMVLMARDSEVL